MSNNSITTIRVLSTVMIVMCHLMERMRIPVLPMVLNVGVHCFFFISGCLYSNKTIHNKAVFYWNRYKRICFPLYVIVAVSVLLNALCGNNIMQEAVIYLLNLQGLNFIFRSISIEAIENIGQTWFLTVIMICYLLIPALQRMRDKKPLLILAGGVFCQ